MAEIREQVKPVPPYVSWRTFETFLQSLKQGVPSRVDRTLMPSLSGSVSSQVQHALRFLGLVEQDGTCTDKLTALVDALKKGEESEDYAVALAGVLREAYGFLFANGGSAFDLERATQGALVEKFRSTGASGETVPKVVNFFLNAAKAAKVPLSPHISTGRPLRTGEQRPRITRKKRIPPSPGEAEKGGVTPKPEDEDDEGTSRRTGPGFREKLLAKFPEFDPSWTPELQSKWFEGFDRFLKMVDQNEKGEGTGSEE
jgi:hypothetical protein